MIHLALSLAVAAAGASCLEPNGTRITAADVAAAVPAFSQLSGDLVLGYAPQPGYTRTFTAAELRQWSSRHDLEGEINDGVCFRRELTPLDPDQVRAAMLTQLPAGAQVQILETGTYGVPKGELVFPLSGLRPAQGSGSPVWKGFVRYAADSKFEVWARVDVRVPYQRVTAVQSLRPGTPIEASSLRLETGYGLPQLAEVAVKVDQVAGRTPRRVVAAGSPVPLSALTESAAVRRGDPVRVQVIAGAASVGFEGVAQANAFAGESVAVRITDSGKVVRVRLKGAGEAVLDLTQGESK